jgi:hypothetical protein
VEVGEVVGIADRAWWAVSAHLRCIEHGGLGEKRGKPGFGGHRPFQYRQKLLPCRVVECEQSSIGERVASMSKRCGDGEVRQIGTFGLGCPAGSARPARR